MPLLASIVQCWFPLLDSVGELASIPETSVKTLSRIFVSAPCSTKNSTTRRCPCLAARCRGVLPIYQTLYWKSDLHQSLLYIVKGVDIGTSAEEEANDLEVAFLGRDMQRRAAVVLNGNKHVYCLFHLPRTECWCPLQWQPVSPPRRGLPSQWPKAAPTLSPEGRGSRLSEDLRSMPSVSTMAMCLQLRCNCDVTTYYRVHRTECSSRSIWRSEWKLRNKQIILSLGRNNTAKHE